MIWDAVMGQLVKMVVDYFANINDWPFLKLSFSFDIELNSRGMDVPQISDVILSVNHDNQELRVHQLLIIRDLVVILLTFANFEYGSVPHEWEFNVFEFLSVCADEFQVQGFVWDRVTL